MHTVTPISASTVEKRSYLAFVAILVGLIYFGLSTPFITILFGYLIVSALGHKLPKPGAVVVFCIIAVGLLYLFIHSVQQAIRGLPSIVEQAIPNIIQHADRMGFNVPFSDTVSLKSYILDEIQPQLMQLAKFAQLFTKEFVYIIVGLVVTCSVYIRSEVDLGRQGHELQSNLYSQFAEALARRFQRFYQSFYTIMGAQVVISAINTFFTGLFLLVLYFCDASLPYSIVIVGVTFLCGLLPIIGNLLSNTVIFFVGLSQSVNLGFLALGYLIVLHKFEYFLNSKIIGGKIKNPMWLTLMALVVGERLGGVPGMILAPVILNYCKVECTRLPVEGPRLSDNPL
jgi:predicted PurR-regulated permease PerM